MNTHAGASALERFPEHRRVLEAIDLYSRLRGPVFSRYDVPTDVRAEETLRQAIVRHWAQGSAAE